MPARGIGTLDGTCPNPGDDSCLSATLLLGNSHFGIQVADAAKGLIAHPIAVVGNIGGKARVALPARNRRLGTVLRVHRSIARELGWNLDHGLVDGHRDRIQILRICLEPQALSLERNRSTAGKWIEQGKRLVTDRLLDLGLRGIKHALIVRVLPHNELAQDVEQPLPLDGLLFRSWKFLGMRGRIINQR